MNAKQRILALVEQFTAPSGRIQHKQFKDYLQTTYPEVYSDFLAHRTECKRLNMHDLRAQCMSFSNGFTLCSCGTPTRYNPHLKGFATYCGSKCSNSDPAKKAVTAKHNLKKYGCTNAANAHKVGYNQRLSELSTDVLSPLFPKAVEAFNTFYSTYSVSATFKPDEAALLQALAKHSEKLTRWYVNLNHSSSNLRLKLATGEIDRPVCHQCQKPVGNTWYAFNKYCSTKCSNMDADHISARHTDIVRAKRSLSIRKHIVSMTDIQRSEFKAKVQLGLSNRTDEAKLNHYKQNIKNRFKSSSFQFNGRTIQVQGYEGVALTYIVSQSLAAPDDIRMQTDDGFKVFKYKLNGKVRTYLPDFYVPTQNRVVEVKSNYTLAGWVDIWETNCAKAKVVLASGFKYSMLVFDAKGSRIELPNNWHTLTFSKIRKLVY